MWLSIRPSSSLGWALFLVISSVLSGCGSDSGQVTIVVKKADTTDAFNDVNALRVLVRDIEEEAPHVFGPFELDREQNVRLSTDIPPGNEFYVDVWACQSVDNCAPIDVVARGCSGRIISEGETPNQSVEIVLHRAGTTNATDCASES